MFRLVPPLPFLNRRLVGLDRGDRTGPARGDGKSEISVSRVKLQDLLVSPKLESGHRFLNEAGGDGLVHLDEGGVLLRIGSHQDAAQVPLDLDFVALGPVLFQKSLRQGLGLRNLFAQDVFGDEAALDVYYLFGLSLEESHLALSGDLKADAVSIMKGRRSGDGIFQIRVGDLSDALQGLFQDLVFESELGLVFEVLPLAAAALEKIRAGRRCPIGGFLEQLENSSPGEVLFFLGQLHADQVAGNTPGNKNLLSLRSPQGLAPRGHPRQLYFEGFLRHTLPQK